MTHVDGADSTAASVDHLQATVILAVIGVGLLVLALRDRRAYRKFKTLTDSRERIKHFRRWTLGGFLLFGVSSVVVLWLVRRLDALTQFPPEFASAMQATGGDPTSYLFGLAFGLTFVIGVIVLANLRAARRKTPPQAATQERAIGDVLPLLPRSDIERPWIALLAVNASVTEEMFFRLVVPLLLTVVIGAPLPAFATACVVFGLVHAYQGPAGVLGTTIIGVVFSAIYLATGSLLAAMAAHLAINLNTLILMPWLRARRAAAQG
jgi:membrane protease YdiL (CAAX protease family)